MKNIRYLSSIILLAGLVVAACADSVTVIIQRDGQKPTSSTTTFPSGATITVSDGAATVAFVPSYYLSCQVCDIVWFTSPTPVLWTFGDGPDLAYSTCTAAHYYTAPGDYKTTNGIVHVTANGWPVVTLATTDDVYAKVYAAIVPTVFVAPAGTYHFSKPIASHVPVQIHGAGVDQTIFQLTPAAGFAFGMGPLSVWDLSIVGTGPVQANFKYGLNGINPSDACAFVGVSWDKLDTPFVCVDHGATRRLFVHHNVSRDIRGNFWYGAGQYNAIYNSQCGPTRLEPTLRSSDPTTTNVIIAGNTISGTPDGIKEPVSERLGGMFDVVGNTIAGRVVAGESVETPNAVQSIQIAGNTITSSSADTGSGDASINVRLGTTLATVTGNKIMGPIHPMQISGSATSKTAVVLSGNVWQVTKKANGQTPDYSRFSDVYGMASVVVNGTDQIIAPVASTQP